MNIEAILDKFAQRNGTFAVNKLRDFLASEISEGTLKQTIEFVLCETGEEISIANDHLYLGDTYTGVFLAGNQYLIGKDCGEVLVIDAVSEQYISDIKSTRFKMDTSSFIEVISNKDQVLLMSDIGKSIYLMTRPEVQSSNLIAYSLSKLSTYEWVRYNMYAEEDIYNRVPGFYFRFHNPGNLYNELAKCIDAFQGDLQWKLYLGLETRNQNYSLEPHEVYQARLTDEYKEHYDLKGILGDKYNELCEKGIKDIPSLSDHIEDWFNIENKMPILPDRD